jgi:hypothetical protein
MTWQPFTLPNNLSISCIIFTMQNILKYSILTMNRGEQGSCMFTIYLESYMLCMLHVVYAVCNKPDAKISVITENKHVMAEDFFVIARLQK